MLKNVNQVGRIWLCVQSESDSGSRLKKVQLVRIGTYAAKATCRILATGYIELSPPRNVLVIKGDFENCKIQYHSK